MYLLRRFLPAILAIFTVCVFLLFVIQPRFVFIYTNTPTRFFYTVLSLVLMNLFLLVYTGYKVGMGQELGARLRFLIFPFITWVSSLTIIAFYDVMWFGIGLTLLVSGALWVWFETLFLLWQMPEFYQPYSLQKLANYFYLFELFLFVSALMGLSILMQLPFWMILVSCTFFVWFIQYDLLKLQQRETKESLAFSLIGTLLAAQLFIALNFLPTQIFFDGIVMGLFFYTWLGIGLQVLQKQIDRQQQILFVSLSSIGIVIVFATTFLI